jgi:hypothetical protein
MKNQLLEQYKNYKCEINNLHFPVDSLSRASKRDLFRFVILEPGGNQSRIPEKTVQS